MMGIMDFDYDESINKAMTQHQRKVSQLQSLKEDLGLYFNKEEAERIARETMKEINPIQVAAEHISVQSIVDKARRDHKRKVSQFQCIKHDIGQYFEDAEAGKLAAEMMKEFNPNDRSGRREKVTIDDIVERAMTDHQRKKSQYNAIRDDLGLIFAKEDVEIITKNVMKRVFANKDPSTAVDGYEAKSGYVENLEKKISELEKQLVERDSEIEVLNDEMRALVISKSNLALNTSKCLDQMRDFLVQYQNYVKLKQKV